MDTCLFSWISIWQEITAMYLPTCTTYAYIYVRDIILRSHHTCIYEDCLTWEKERGREREREPWVDWEWKRKEWDNILRRREDADASFTFIPFQFIRLYMLTMQCFHPISFFFTRFYCETTLLPEQRQVSTLHWSRCDVMRLFFLTLTITTSSN